MTKSENLIKLIEQESTLHWSDPEKWSYLFDSEYEDEILDTFGLKDDFEEEARENSKGIEIPDGGWDEPRYRDPTEDEQWEFEKEEYQKLVDGLKFVYTFEEDVPMLLEWIKTGKLKIEKSKDAEWDKGIINGQPVIVGYYDTENKEPNLNIPVQFKASIK